MPVFLIPIAIAAGSTLLGGTGVVLGAKGIQDSKEAERLLDEVQAAYDEQIALTQSRYTLSEDSLGRWGRRKHELYDDQVRRFVTAFDCLAAAGLTQLEGSADLQEFVRALEAEHINFELLDAAGAILAGGGTAAASYAIAWGAVGSFGLASTGTAISTLSGSAASNAILAWFGGGALSAGGLGAGVGGTILGGAVAGPAVIAAGAIVRKKGADALRQAKAETTRMQTATQEAKAWAAAYGLLDRLAQDYLSVADHLAARLEPQLLLVENLTHAGLRLDDLDDEDLAATTVAANTAALLKGLLDMPLVDADSGRPRQTARHHINKINAELDL